MGQPLVSVVMSVYNGGDNLADSIDSILQQADVNFEFVIVNDGSTDNSLSLLKCYAANDHRIKLIDQENTGLTRALVKGCELASGTYIARQDADDRSVAGRLCKQVTLLQADPTVVLVSGGTQFLAPEGEALHVYQPDSDIADQSLRHIDIDKLSGPPHPCTMFRRDDYLAVGGYRPQFQVAQDLDLWTRLIERGKHVVEPSIVYEMILAPGGISSLRAGQQRETKQVIVACMLARRNGQADEDKLVSLSASPANVFWLVKRVAQARFFYFIGSMLDGREVAARRKYFFRSLSANPFFWRSWVRLLQTFGRMST